MAEHTYSARVEWRRDGATFTDQRYSRRHEWSFDGGITLPASASPQVVPVPLSDPLAVDPEEAFVAALSSCHMLFFLAFAAKRGLVVERYEDHATGTMAPRSDGRVVMSRVTLRPRVRYHGAAPEPALEAQLHHAAHDACYLANSVRTNVMVEPEQGSDG